jgi:hypothetical protein
MAFPPEPEGDTSIVIEYLESTGRSLAGLFGGWGILKKTRVESRQRLDNARMERAQQYRERIVTLAREYFIRIRNDLEKQESKFAAFDQEESMQNVARCCTRILVIPKKSFYASCRLIGHPVFLHSDGEIRIERPGVRITLNIEKGKKVDLAEVGIPGYTIDFSSPENGLELLCTGPDAKIWTTDAETNGAKVVWEIEGD